jgi:hypothetical protein
VTVKLPIDQIQRKAAVVFVKVIATAVLTAVAGWRLGHLFGLGMDILGLLLFLGLPLIGFFLAGIACLTVVAWVVGMLSALAVLRLKLKGRWGTLVAIGLAVLAIVVTWVLWLPLRPLESVAAWVVVMIGICTARLAAWIVLCAVFWCLSRLLGPHRSGLLAWGTGIVAIAMLDFFTGAFLPNSDFLIFVFVAGFARIVSLLAPWLVLDIAYPNTKDVRGSASLAVAHGAILSLAISFTWYAVSHGLGWARAAVHIHLLPLLGVWIVGICLLAFLGWLVNRGMARFACALALIAALWLASAYVERARGPLHRIPPSTSHSQNHLDHPNFSGAFRSF